MSDKPKKEKNPKKEKKEKAVKMKKCPACQQEIPKKAKVCPHCAAKQKKSILPLILALVLVLLLAAGVSIMVFHFPVAPPFELPFSLPFGASTSKSYLGETMGLTSKQEKAVLAVFEECGFAEISEVSQVSSNSHSTSYAVQDTETAKYLDTEDAIVVQVDNESKAITSITFREYDIYANGQAVTPVTNFYLDLEARDEYLAATLSAVRARLEVPEAAVFPSRSHWSFALDGKHVTVQSSVTAIFEAGKEETKTFVAEFEDGELASLTFGEAEEQTS